MELTKLTLSELKKLKTRVENEISRRTDTTKRDLLKKMQKMAADAGIAFTEIIGEKPSSTPINKKVVKKKTAGAPKGVKVAAKYHNPQNASQTWTGRGLKPKWLTELLAQGQKLDDLLIK